MRKNGVVHQGSADIVLLGLGILLAAYLTGCAFGVEVQWRGKTGIDNRSATSLVPAKRLIKDKEEY